jgi:hypothetical protein
MGRMQPEILSRASWEAMQSPAPYDIGKSSWYGFGLFVTPVWANGERLGNVNYHDGKSPGAVAGFYSLPNGVVAAWAFNSRDQKPGCAAPLVAAIAGTGPENRMARTRPLPALLRPMPIPMHSLFVTRGSRDVATHLDSKTRLPSTKTAVASRG